MSDDYGWIEGWIRMETWRDAIASVSLSHPENCTCDVCRAASGDRDAFVRIVARLEVAREEVRDS